MGVSINTADDWKLVEGREAVTYFSKTEEQVPASGTSVPNAKRFPIKKDELQADSLLAEMDAVWRVWKNQLGGIVPKVNDLLKDADGVRWIVRIVEVLSLGQCYRLTCQQSQRTG